MGRLGLKDEEEWQAKVWQVGGQRFWQGDRRGEGGEAGGAAHAGPLPAVSTPSPCPAALSHWAQEATALSSHRPLGAVRCAEPQT